MPRSSTPDAGRENLRSYPAEKARQGEIILRTRTQRIIFIAGLAGMLLVGLIATIIH